MIALLSQTVALNMKTAHLLRMAWLAWLVAAMLFFSGIPGSGGLVVAAVAAGFVFTGPALARGLFSLGKHPGA